MIYKFHFKYWKISRMCWEYMGNDELLNITDIYNDFGNPKNLSPRRFLKTRVYKDLLSEKILEANYEIEKVIKYCGKDIYADAMVAMLYLMHLNEVYVRNKSIDNISVIGLKSMLKDNMIENEEMEYIDGLPF
jgi:hypothetical protein